MPEKLLCASSDISETTAKICELEGVEIGVIRHKGTVVAYRNVCPHQGGPVCEGLKMPTKCISCAPGTVGNSRSKPARPWATRKFVSIATR